MNESKWRLLLESPLGCRVMAFAGFGLCLFAVINNVNHRSGGRIESLSEFLSYIETNEILISIIGIYMLFAFLYAAKNAEKMKREKWRNYKPGKTIEDPYENVIADYEARQRMKPIPYTMGSGEYEITFLVSPGYSWDGEASVREEIGYVSAAVMTSEIGSVASCRYHVATEDELLEEDYDTPEELVQENYESLAKRTKENTPIQQMIVDEKNIVHYYIARYKKNNQKWQKAYAVCEVEHGKVFELELSYASWEYKVTEKDIELFFTFV